MNNTHCLTSNTSGSHWPLIVVSYLTLWGKVLSTIKVRSTMILPMHHVKPPLRTCWNKSSIYIVFFTIIQSRFQYFESFKKKQERKGKNIQWLLCGLLKKLKIGCIIRKIYMTPLTQVVFVNDEVTISFLRKSERKVVFLWPVINE